MPECEVDEARASSTRRIVTPFGLGKSRPVRHGARVINRGIARRIRLRDISMLSVVTIGVCSFVLLTGSAESARLEVTRTVDANYRSSYDILVRPEGSQTSIEAKEGTVRPNYLSGIYGGISTKQVSQIRSVPRSRGSRTDRHGGSGHAKRLGTHRRNECGTCSGWTIALQVLLDGQQLERS